MKAGQAYVCRSPQEFIPGLQLNRGFYHDVVQPILDRHYPGLDYAAALIGHCSDVLGFDTYKSTDHVWGPRLQIFLSEADYARLALAMFDLFAQELPPTYLHFPTNYQRAENWFRTANMQFVDGPPINHFIDILTVPGFFNNDISIDLANPPGNEEWFTFPEQALLELTSGEVFHDGPGELTWARKLLGYYPDEVRFFRMYCLWDSISEERAFVGRCWDAGDAVGERLILARIANKLMKLCFAIERQYYPYSKWFGSAFRRLKYADRVLPHLERALDGGTYPEREEALCQAYLAVARWHNENEITLPIEPEIINYYQRGYRGLETAPFAAALKEKVKAFEGVYDFALLGKTVLHDDSNFGHGYETARALVSAAHKATRVLCKVDQGTVIP